MESGEAGRIERGGADERDVWEGGRESRGWKGREGGGWGDSVAGMW